MVVIKALLFFVKHFYTQDYQKKMLGEPNFLIVFSLIVLDELGHLLVPRAEFLGCGSSCVLSSEACTPNVHLTVPRAITCLRKGNTTSLSSECCLDDFPSMNVCVCVCPYKPCTFRVCTSVVGQPGSQQRKECGRGKECRAD